MCRLHVLAPTLVSLVASACGDNRMTPPRADAAPPTDVADAAVFSWPGMVFGGAAGDEVLDLEYAGDTLYVAGYRDGLLGQANLQPGGDAVGVLAAYGRDGTLRWEQLFDTNGADTVDAMDLGTSDIAVVGRTSAAFPGFFNGGQVDAFVARVPYGGTTIPELRQFGDARPQHMVRITRDPSGALLVAGYEDVFVENQAVTAFENPAAARITTALTLDWYRRDEAHATSDWYFAVASPGVTGEIVVGGGVLSGVAEGPFVRRHDPLGTPRWTRQLGSAGADAVAAIVRHSDGKLYVAGTTFQVVGAQSYGEQDFFVAVLDPATGVVERAMQAGSTLSEYARDMVIAPDGSIYVVGETLGALPGQTYAGEYDLAIVRFAADGTWTGSWQRGTTGDETIHAVVIAGDALYVGGYQVETNVPGTTAAGGQDGFVLRVPLADLVAP